MACTCEASAARRARAAASAEVVVVLAAPKEAFGCKAACCDLGGGLRDRKAGGEGAAGRSSS